MTKSVIWILSHLCVLLFGVIVVLSDYGGELVKAVGVSIVASAAVGLSLAAYIYVLHGPRERLKDVELSGIQRVFPYRSVNIRSEYEERLDKARSQIDIMGFGLATLLDDFREDFKSWTSRAEIRILLLDPQYPDAEHSFAADRDRQEGDPAGTILSQVQAFCQTVNSIVESERFKVKLYRSAPSINYFRVDDVVFWGPYFVAERSRNMPTLLVKRDGFLFHSLSGHFDRLWHNHSREVPETWLRATDD